MTLRPWKQACRNAGRLLYGPFRGCRRSYRTPSRLLGSQVRPKARKHTVPARRTAGAPKCVKTYHPRPADCRSAGRRENRPSPLGGLSGLRNARKLIVSARRLVGAPAGAKKCRPRSAHCRSAGRREQGCKGAMPSDSRVALLALANAPTERHLDLGESEARIRPKFPPRDKPIHSAAKFSAAALESGLIIAHERNS